jgi:hypothetical protein
MNARQATILNQILSDKTDRQTRAALVREYARLEAQPIPAGTRVRTIWGTGSVQYPDAVPVLFDVAAQQPPVKLGLVPADKIEVIEPWTATTTPATANREGGAS